MDGWGIRELESVEDGQRYSQLPVGGDTRTGRLKTEDEEKT